MIAKEVAKRLGMTQNILNPGKLAKSQNEELIASYCDRVAPHVLLFFDRT